MSDKRIKVGDILRHKLTKEKILVLKEFFIFDRVKGELDRSSWECRTEDYRTLIFKDMELESLEEK